MNTGLVSFNPADNFSGAALLPYELCDAEGACAQANITFNVTAVNDPPVADDDATTMSEGGTLTSNVTGNDSDVETPNSGLIWSLLDGSNADANGTLTFNANGSYTYVPDPGFNGSATFTYQVCDPGPLCEPATVVITITGVDDTPAANNDAGPAIAEDGSNGTVNILINDTDLDGNPTAPTNGVGQFVADLDPATVGVQTSITTAEGVWTYAPSSGEVVFDPIDNYFGNATISYELCDPTALCDQATISFLVNSVNDAPVANDDNGGTLAEDGGNGTVAILTNDTDADGAPSAPTNGPGQFSVDLDPGARGCRRA